MDIGNVGGEEGEEEVRGSEKMSTKVFFPFV